MTDPQPETGAEVDFIREDLIQALAGSTPNSASPPATSCSTTSRFLRVRTRSWARLGCRGGTSAAITISISKRQTRKYSRETFKRVFGPNYYAFFYGQTLFLMLDDVTISDSTA